MRDRFAASDRITRAGHGFEEFELIESLKVSLDLCIAARRHDDCGRTSSVSDNHRLIGCSYASNDLPCLSLKIGNRYDFLHGY